MSKESDLLFCPLQEVANILSRKWTFQIVYEIGNHTQIRFNELAKELRYITPKTLADTLLKLKNENLIQKKVFGEFPVRVEYSLTKEGLTLYQIVVDLLEWTISRSNAKVKQCSCELRPDKLLEVEVIKRIEVFQLTN